MTSHHPQQAATLVIADLQNLNSAGHADQRSLKRAGREPIGPTAVPPLEHCYLGDDITGDDARAALNGTAFSYHQPADITAAVTGLLAGGEIVARCAGRMEFGARALGNRSILADPANADLPRLLNQLIKRRDFWMPFAPAILASQQHTYIHNPKHLPSPYMMLAFHSQTDKVNEFIAAVHGADLTCRPQLIPDDSGCGLAAILRAYQARTGRGVLLDTSLNLHGQPIARPPRTRCTSSPARGCGTCNLAPASCRRRTLNVGKPSPPCAHCLAALSAVRI